MLVAVATAIGFRIPASGAKQANEALLRIDRKRRGYLYPTTFFSINIFGYYSG